MQIRLSKLLTGSLGWLAFERPASFRHPRSVRQTKNQIGYNFLSQIAQYTIVNQSLTTYFNNGQNPNNNEYDFTIYENLDRNKYEKLDLVWEKTLNRRLGC